MEGLETSYLLNAPWLYEGEDKESRIPLVSTVNEDTGNISPTKATQTGGDFLSQEETAIFGRRDVAVHYNQIPTVNTAACSLSLMSTN